MTAVAPAIRLKTAHFKNLDPKMTATLYTSIVLKVLMQGTIKTFSRTRWHSGIGYATSVGR
jgi:hypothetical protein